MKLWLLDADVIIDLLGLDIFDKLVKIHQVHVASTVVDEVKHYWRDGEKVSLDFRQAYVRPGRVREVGATAEVLAEIIKRLPEIKRESLHAGELEFFATVSTMQRIRTVEIPAGRRRFPSSLDSHSTPKA